MLYCTLLQNDVNICGQSPTSTNHRGNNVRRYSCPYVNLSTLFRVRLIVSIILIFSCTLLYIANHLSNSTLLSRAFVIIYAQYFGVNSFKASNAHDVGRWNIESVPEVYHWSNDDIRAYDADDAYDDSIVHSFYRRNFQLDDSFVENARRYRVEIVAYVREDVHVDDVEHHYETLLHRSIRVILHVSRHLHY